MSRGTKDLDGLVDIRGIGVENPTPFVWPELARTLITNEPQKGASEEIGSPPDISKRTNQRRIETEPPCPPLIITRILEKDVHLIIDHKMTTMLVRWFNIVDDVCLNRLK
jgi:hypothetical protein